MTTPADLFEYMRNKIEDTALQLSAAQAERDEWRAEAERLRAQVVTLEALWQRAIDADLLDDPHELGNAIADASALLNYPPPGDDD